MLIDLQFDVKAHSDNASMLKKETKTEKKKERERERESKRKSHEKQEYKNSSASRDALSADQKESPDSRKKYSDHPGRVFSLSQKEPPGPTICQCWHF